MTPARTWPALGIALLVAALCGCGGGSGTPAAQLTTLVVTPDKCTMDVGTDRQFVAKGYDQRGNQISIAPIWSVEGNIGTATPAAATCSLHASAQGTGKLVATENGTRGEADVTVVGPEDRQLTNITMQPPSATLHVGDTLDIAALGFDQYGDPCDLDPVWSVTGGIGAVAPTVLTAATSSTHRFTAGAQGDGYVRAVDGSAVGQTSIQVLPAGTGPLTNLFFLHHSTGDGIVTEGNMRAQITSYNAGNGTSFTFWDHGYNYEGLRGPSGGRTGTSYNIPGDNTDPDGLHTLWTTANAARTSIMGNHQVIAFKSCFPASAIPDAATLNQYKQWYLQMRDYFDAHPERLFIVMSTPPLHRLSTDVVEADNARAFADWLKSPQYLSGHPNITCFDLLDALAKPDDGSATRNMLRYDYEMSHGDGDSHPNALANETVGPAFAAFLIQAATAYSP